MLVYEIATLYLRAYLLILSIIIPNCEGVVAEGWWNFSMSLKALHFQVKPLQNFGTGKQCVKYAKIWAFSEPYFPVYGQSHIHIFAYLDRIRESVQIWENTGTIPSIYRKIPIMESPYFGILSLYQYKKIEKKRSRYI